MEIFNCFSIFYSKPINYNQITEPKKPAPMGPYTKIIINSDFTKIELTEDFIMEMKSDEDFEPKFHKQFMDFISRYENARIYLLDDKHIWRIVNEIFEKWIIAIKIHPLSSEYFEERREIYRVFSGRSFKFRMIFQKKFIYIWRNQKFFEEPEQSAIHRSWVFWYFNSTNDCDKLEEFIKLKL